MTMSKSDFLLEIGLEEIPARFILDASKQLSQKLEELLQKQNIAYGEVKSYSTPRRLAVFIKDVANKQADIHEEVKGPAKKIAVDENGNWTKAAIGFTKGQGKTVDDIYFKEVGGVEYVFVEKHIHGQNTIDCLTDLKDLITSIHFPISMRWGNFDLRYIRPIRWIVALFGEQVINLQIANVRSGNVSYGHRFLGKEITIQTPQQYKTLLEEQFVIVDYAERKQRILKEIHSLEEENQWQIPIDPELLEEVTNLVEYPTVLYGTFEKEFLKLPKEVLITSMKDHQRYFPVMDQAGNLLNYFITVRNGNDYRIENVKKGNEKVIRARLQDAVFFYEEDQKVSVGTYVNKLEKVLYHDEIGSYKDKLNRIKAIATFITNELKVPEEVQKNTLRAAEICKFDLVTAMVDEFTDLQGVIGEYYAKNAGENEVVAKAINEHYMPRHADGELPQSDVGAIVAISDKLDTLASFFAIQRIPTGSQDPYSLRRQATGVVQILANKGWKIDFSKLLKEAIRLTESFAKESMAKIYDDLLHFFKLRFKHLLQEKGIRYDIIDAVLQAPITSVESLIHKSHYLNQVKETPNFKEEVEALSRVVNLANKAETVVQIQAELFENDTEVNLYNQFMDIAQKFYEENIEEQYQLLVNLKPAITDFFDHTMVMADDEKVRNNRLSLLKKLGDLILSYAHFPTILVK